MILLKQVRRKCFNPGRIEYFKARTEVYVSLEFRLNGI